MIKLSMVNTNSMNKLSFTETVQISSIRQKVPNNIFSFANNTSEIQKIIRVEN